MRNKNAKVSDPNSFIAPSGDKYHILYSTKVTPRGDVVLSECGKEDIQEYINSYRESTDMSFILHQLAIGNTSVLNQKQAMYGDFTDVPENLAEAQQILIDGEVAFNQLPLDVRQKFDNNFRNWLFTSGSEAWTEKMSDLIKKVETVSEVVEEEVKEDVS